MRVKTVSGIMLTLLLTSMLTLAFNIQLVEAEPGTIYIRADGSIDPPTANITSADNITYTFTNNINDSIVVERDSIVIDGASYKLQGSGSGTGFNLTGINNVTIQNTNIKNFNYGVYLVSSSSSTVSGNTITNSHLGVDLLSSSNNTVSGNTITNSTVIGIRLYLSCNNNTVSGNTITNSNTGVGLSSSSNNNTVSGNNITNNYFGVGLSSSSNNNTVSGNNITNNGWGVMLGSSSNNTVSGNNITNITYCGVRLDWSSGNTFYHNNFIDNTQYVDIIWPGYANFWNSSYPSGGNYWSNYIGVDEKSGPNQDEAGSDGIGDTPHVLDPWNQDNYPLVNPWRVRDVAVIEVLPNAHGHEKHYAYQTWTINVSVTVLNNGTALANFTVTAYHNESATFYQIGNQTVTNLAPNSNTTVTFTWNLSGVSHFNHTVKANVTLISVADANPANNEAYSWLKVNHWGDVNGDGYCNILDIKLVKLAYSGFKPPDLIIPPLNADLDNNGAINILDLKIEKLIYSGIL